MNKFTLALVIAMFATTGLAQVPKKPTVPAPPPELLVGTLSTSAAAIAALAFLALVALIGTSTTISTVSTD